MRSIPDIIQDSKIIAVVGLSPRPERPSHIVARYLQEQGFRILPVNPGHAGQRILGEPVHATLNEAADAAAAEGRLIDIVDCFRNADAMPQIARDAVAARARCLWMQLGIANQQAADLALAAGLDVVQDSCLKVYHAMTAGR
jgi:hypothetical protein